MLTLNNILNNINNVLSLKAFNPSFLQGLASWFDASDLSTLTVAGTAVSQWNDKSGNGKHISQAIGANQPDSGVNSMNGLNVIYFDGVLDVLYGSAGVNPSSNSMTIFCVSKGIPTTIFDDVWSFGIGLLRQEESTTFRIYSTGVVAIDGVALGNSNPANIVSFVANGANFEARFNGGNVKSGTSAGMTSSSNFYVGGRTDLSNQWNGDIAEIIIYNRPLTTKEMNQIGLYLSRKWGISWSII